MNFMPGPDDIEPLDAGERCDKVYGHYHIGREDESRNELALFFEARLLPEPDFLERGLWSIINRNSGRLIAFSEYASTEYSDDQLQELLCANMRFARGFEVRSNPVLSVVIVELVAVAMWNVDAALRVYTAYLGYGDISWPSDFRSIINAGQEYV